MKKILFLSICLIMLLTGCGSKDASEPIIDEPQDNIATTDNTDDSKDDKLWESDGNNYINQGDDLEKSEIYGYSYSDEGYLVKTSPDIATNMDGSTTELESVYDDFEGVLYKDYSKQNNEDKTDFKNKTVISAVEYSGDIDIDTTKEDWDTLYNNLISNPDNYKDKVIKIQGVGYTDKDTGMIRVGNSNNMIDYIAAKYPNGGSNVQVIGVITYNNNGEILIDAEEVAIVY